MRLWSNGLGKSQSACVIEMGKDQRGSALAKG